MPRRTKEPSFARMAATIAILGATFLVWKLGLFDAIGRRLVDFSMESMQNASRDNEPAR